MEPKPQCGECGGTKDILDGVKIAMPGYDSEGTPVLEPLCAHCFMYLSTGSQIDDEEPKN